MDDRTQRTTNAPPARPLTERPRWANRLASGRELRHIEQASADTQSDLDLKVGLESLVHAMREQVRMTAHRVLYSGTLTIGPAGFSCQRFSQGSKALFIVNYASNSNVTVYAGPAGTTAPGPGAGVHNVPAGVALVINDDTMDWTYWGTPGQNVDLQIFGVWVPPTAAGAI